MESRAHAVWNGTLAEGNGEATLATGIGGPLPVSWPSRTEAPAGKTSPEELVAAAHAACYSMALSGILGRAGFTSIKLETDATATFEKMEPGWRLTRMALRVVGEVPGMEEAAFVAAAADAKDGCPVSNALKGNVEITVESALA